MNRDPWLSTNFRSSEYLNWKWMTSIPLTFNLNKMLFEKKTSKLLLSILAVPSFISSFMPIICIKDTLKTRFYGIPQISISIGRFLYQRIKSYTASEKWKHILALFAICNQCQLSTAKQKINARRNKLGLSA